MRFKKPTAILSFLAIAALFAAYLMVNGKFTAAVPVLNYHQVNDTEKNSLTLETEQFAAQMKYLHDAGYTTITVKEMLDAFDGGGSLPEKPVVITFDDGYMDNYRNAFPILSRYNFKATIFLVTDYINIYPNYLTWNDAYLMQQSGLIEFESHTLSHRDFLKMSGETARLELTGSRQALKWHLKKDAKFLAYPTGVVDRKMLPLVEEAGYKAAFTVNYGLCSKDSYRLALPRIPIFGCNTHTLLRFKLRLWFAPVIEPLNQFRLALVEQGFTNLAQLVPIP